MLALFYPGKYLKSRRERHADKKRGAKKNVSANLLLLFLHSWLPSQLDPPEPVWSVSSALALRWLTSAGAVINNAGKETHINQAVVVAVGGSRNRKEEVSWLTLTSLAQSLL